MFNTDTHKKDLVGTIAAVTVTVLMVLLVLLVLPITDGFVADTKTFLLLISAIVIGLLYVGKAVMTKGFQMVSSPVLLPTLLFGILVIVSAVVAKPYPVEELLGMGGSWIAWALIILVGGALIPKNFSKHVVPILSGIGVTLTVLSVLQLVGFGPAQLLNQTLGLTIPDGLAFSLVGSPLVALQVLVIAAVGMTGSVLKEKLRSPINLALLVVLIVGIGLHLWAIRPNGPSPVTLPSLTSSWSVMLDSIRSPRAALIGSGPSSYANNYRMYKPLFVNGTTSWSTVFSSATSTPLTLLSTVGIAGFLIWALAMYQMVREAKSEWKDQMPLSLAVIASVIWFVFLPATPVMIGLQALLLISLLASSHHRPKFHLTALIDKVVLNPMNFGVEGMHNQRKAPALPVYALSVVFAAALLFSLYGVGRAYYAFTLQHQASQASIKNDALGLYNSQQAAVRALPYLDTMRRTYAITNLLIATGMSNNQDLTDDERQQISTLLQQAVSEARAAAYLDPNDATNWQVLAQVYQNMIGVAQDAEQWTTQTYVSAIQVYPSDPQLRLALGGVLLNANQDQQALSVFQQAVNVKPDLANAHYNVAQAYLKLQQYDAAKQEYDAVLQLLDPTSEDYTKATSELEQIQKLIDEQPAADATTGDQTGDAMEKTSASTPSLLDQQLNTPAEQAVQQTGETQPVSPTGTPEPTGEAMEPSVTAAPAQ
ncbi:hypothetical protein KC921_02560 [Candidatus Woesebacteria bacterium]|nr:hypothetical protein [Candidatus Woesebacteria bacterium]